MYREEGESGHYISIGLLRPGRWRQCPGGVAMSCHHHKQINNNKHTSNTFWVRNSNWLVLSAEYLCFLILCVQRNDSWSWLLSLLLRRRIVPLIFWLILQYKMELTLRLVRSVTSWQLKTIHGKLTNFELIIHVSSDWWCRPRPWTDEKMTQCRDFLWLHLLCWYYEYLLSYIRAPDLVSRCVSFQKTTLMRNCSKHGNKHTALWCCSGSLSVEWSGRRWLHILLFTLCIHLFNIQYQISWSKSLDVYIPKYWIFLVPNCLVILLWYTPLSRG